MLIDGLYKVLSQQQAGQQIVAEIMLQEDHAVFKGHFPGQPVLPGVCMIQILKEILEGTVQQTLFFTAGDSKFLTLLDPRQHPVIRVDIRFDTTNGDVYTIDARLYHEDLIFIKLKGLFSTSF